MGEGSKMKKDGRQLGVEFGLLPDLIFLLHVVKTINEVGFFGLLNYLYYSVFQSCTFRK